ncbi:MAG: hypothetical protein MUE53_03680 [Chitinophagales bacterium]|jgi:hypothetical protein|nr:hypothetical protein [Chitinophagales bacterium]
MQRDYYLIQVHKMGEMLRKLLEVLLGSSNFEEIRKQEAFRLEDLSLLIPFLLDHSSEEIWSKLQEISGMNEENLNLVAEILYELAKKHEMSLESIVTTKSLYAKSLFLYQAIDRISLAYHIQRKLRIQELSEYLKGS